MAPAYHSFLSISSSVWGPRSHRKTLLWALWSAGKGRGDITAGRLKFWLARPQKQRTDSRCCCQSGNKDSFFSLWPNLGLQVHKALFFLWILPLISGNRCHFFICRNPKFSQRTEPAGIIRRSALPLKHDRKSAHSTTTARPPHTCSADHNPCCVLPQKLRGKGCPLFNVRNNMSTHTLSKIHTCGS